MNWESIILAIVGLGVFGDILLRILFKSDRRIADAKADVAESEAFKAKNDAHAEQCRQYEERIQDLHKNLDKMTEQVEHFIERDGAKEERFDKQTEKLRETQRELLIATQKETQLARHIGELELELEKKRCDDLPCAFRQPPNAHTTPRVGLNKEEYFRQRDKKDKK